MNYGVTATFDHWFQNRHCVTKTGSARWKRWVFFTPRDATTTSLASNSAMDQYIDDMAVFRKNVTHITDSGLFYMSKSTFVDFILLICISKWEKSMTHERVYSLGISA